MTIQLERLERIIEAYGASPDNWPLNERAAAEVSLLSHKDNPAILQALASASLLDEALNACLSPTAALEPSVGPLMERIEREGRQPPERYMEKLMDWLFPSSDHLLFSALLRPALMGLIPMVFGIVLGIVTIEQPPQYAIEEELQFLAITINNNGELPNE